MTQPTLPAPRAPAARVPDHLAGAVVLALLILTAWGNAVAMLVVAAGGLAVALVVFPSAIARTLLGALLAAALAALVVVLWLS